MIPVSVRFSLIHRCHGVLVEYAVQAVNPPDSAADRGRDLGVPGPILRLVFRAGREPALASIPAAVCGRNEVGEGPVRGRWGRDCRRMEMLSQRAFWAPLFVGEW